MARMELTDVRNATVSLRVHGAASMALRFHAGVLRAQVVDRATKLVLARPGYRFPTEASLFPSCRRAALDSTPDGALRGNGGRVGA
jgi:hypothetical protein